MVTVSMDYVLPPTLMMLSSRLNRNSLFEACTFGDGFSSHRCRLCRIRKIEILMQNISLQIVVVFYLNIQVRYVTYQLKSHRDVIIILIYK